MAGLRERKKEQTRQRIAAAAARLFADRGYESVTVAQIAEAAEVAKVTLFEYFPSKESLALNGVASEDLAAIVAARPSGQDPLEALHDFYRDLARHKLADLDTEAIMARMRVIFDSPALSGAANALLYRQRTALAEALTAEYGEPRAALAAAAIAACLLTVKESFFAAIASGGDPAEAGALLDAQVEIAFDLLRHGITSQIGHLCAPEASTTTPAFFQD